MPTRPAAMVMARVQSVATQVPKEGSQRLRRRTEPSPPLFVELSCL